MERHLWFVRPASGTGERWERLEWHSSLCPCTGKRSEEAAQALVDLADQDNPYGYLEWREGKA